LQHASWLSPERPGQAGEAVVAPGADVEIEVTLAAGVQSRERFQLLLEGLLWLPETEFLVDSAAGEVTMA
jgi:hypothetical protein